MSTMRPETTQRGFGLVAAMFLIVIIAALIAVMARLALTQNATNSLAIQQARAYQAARAGLELGIYRVLDGQDCAAVFDLDGFQVSVATCPSQDVGTLPEEGRAVSFFSVESTAEFGAPGSPDYAYRRLTATVEREN